MDKDNEDDDNEDDNIMDEIPMDKWRDYLRLPGWRRSCKLGNLSGLGGGGEPPPLILHHGLGGG